MIELYRSFGREMRPVDKITPGTWVELTSPTADEAKSVAKVLGIDQDDVLAAIDPEEKARVQTEDDYTLIVVDMPAREERHHEQVYNTIPLGIILTAENVVTVCSEETSVLSSFHTARIRDLSTENRLAFVYRIMLRIALRYQQVLASIDHTRMEFEERIEKVADERDLIQLHELESTLVYFSTSLRGNASVLSRLTRYGHLNQPEDRDILDDAIVENQQAIEMAQIYREVIDGTRQLVSSIMDSRLNNVMERLTSITIVLSIPTVISGAYGMNVAGEWMPFSNAPHGFMIINIITMIACVVIAIILKNRRVL
ncbi:MAG: magnesium transporter CorA family protein [Atopobiaceae bacterium]|nr:magnesium transporter CorA family protein [Atopobiaceae bacterium]